MLVEQAIFTSAHTDRGDGYQVTAHSSGVTEAEVRELSTWGPSHGALIAQRDETSSVNFHRLAGGKFCVSKTIAAGREFSQRGGARIYTQSLLITPAILARFANNAFAVLRAAWAKGALTVHDTPPAKLPAFSLVGRSAIVDEGLLGQLADSWQAQRVGRLVAAAMSDEPKLLAGAENNETLFGGLINCFPVECRTEVTFTTGLRYSPRRPFRLTTLDSDPASVRQAARQEDVTIVDLRDSTIVTEPCTGWAAYVARAIELDQLAHLTTALQQPRPELTIGQLDDLGGKLLEELESSGVKDETSSREHSAPRRARASSSSRQSAIGRQSASSRLESTVSRQQTESVTTATIKHPHRGPALALTSSVQTHTVSDPETIELLEQLDDAVYDCIHGAPNVIELINSLWLTLSQRLRPDVLAAAREQYLRYALTLWEACHDSAAREPQRAVRALDVLIALFERDA